ncbi:MAG: hypothetical protein [Bacteriophage sp.]|nr:MAG: hypothetical protein [Bacteriophage sp.]
MTTAKRLTKAQKASLAESEVKALSGHHVAIIGGTSIGTSPALPDELEAIQQIEQDRLANEFTAEAKEILGFVLAGGTATITGDLKHAFIRRWDNKDIQNELVRAMVDVGLLDFTSYPHNARSLYHLAVSQKGIDYLSE